MLPNRSCVDDLFCEGSLCCPTCCEIHNCGESANPSQLCSYTPGRACALLVSFASLDGRFPQAILVRPSSYGVLLEISSRTDFRVVIPLCSNKGS